LLPSTHNILLLPPNWSCGDERKLNIVSFSIKACVTILGLTITEEHSKDPVNASPKAQQRDVDDPQELLLASRSSTHRIYCF
jgi:hypothetical protein